MIFSAQSFVQRGAMQDRYLVVAILVILAICCLGGYVAVSGYLISHPPSLSALATGVAATPLVIVVSTDTPAPAQPAAAPRTATAPPVPSPLGAFETIAAASTTQPTPPPPTAGKPVSPPTVAPVTTGESCGTFTFCAKGGPPDFSLGPTGKECPTNYIWGRVVDKNGTGMPDMRIRFKLLATGESDNVVSKGPPDPAGVYNIPVQPGSTWVVWLTDAGNQISPQVTVTLQSYGGAGNCPTRVDFVQQR